MVCGIKIKLLRLGKNVTGRQTPLLDKINTPEQLRQLSASQLPALADDLRCDMIKAVSQTGGHLGAGLGVIELTIALHYIFDTPDDLSLIHI